MKFSCYEMYCSPLIYFFMTVLKNSIFFLKNDNEFCTLKCSEISKNIIATHFRMRGLMGCISNIVIYLSMFTFSHGNYLYGFGIVAVCVCKTDTLFLFALDLYLSYFDLWMRSLPVSGNDVMEQWICLFLLLS